MRFDIPLPNSRPRALTLRQQRQRMNTEALERAAVRLSCYFTLRAEREPALHGLSAAFFAAHLKSGHRSFFGVLVGDGGELLEDAQRPATFIEFRRRESRVADAAPVGIGERAAVDDHESPLELYTLIDENDLLRQMVA
jgi:hypothetical protein